MQRPATRAFLRGRPPGLPYAGTHPSMGSRMSEASTAGMADVVSPLDKGLGALSAPCAPQDAAAQGWNLLREDLGLPAAVLSQSRLAHNLAWMQRFVDAYGAKLAPHGKTTMAPRLFHQAEELETGIGQQLGHGGPIAPSDQLVGHEHAAHAVVMGHACLPGGGPGYAP